MLLRDDRIKRSLSYTLIHRTNCIECISLLPLSKLAHLGSKPQRVKAEGGYRAAGRSKAQANVVVDAADLMLQRGAVMLLLEAVPVELSQRVVDLAQSSSPPVPVIGCGAGSPCHGHVVVLHDLLGLTDWQPPFAQPMVNVGKQLQAVAAAWVEQIATGRYPNADHPYKTRP